MINGDLRSLTREQLRELLTGMGEKAFRADQIFSWLHEKLAFDYEEMTNLPGALRARLAKEYPLEKLTLETVRISREDGTRKYLFGLPDGHVVESVWMEYHHGVSVCISTQVGCRMGCRFCASTLDGWVRNLTPAELLLQVYAMQKEGGKRIANIVLMGTGEPLDNYDNVVAFIRLVSHEKGLHISQRNITLSTCGLVEGIRRLAEEELSVTLALSLHAPTDEKRRALMPIARKYALKDVLSACRYYYDCTGRRLTFEYALAEGQNDSPEDAQTLTTLLRGLNCHINLIPVNPIKERDFVQTRRPQVLAFQKKLEMCGFNVTIRREMGRDIDGACGQLRKRYMDKKE